MAAVERRLTCEGLLGAEERKHTTGIYDDAMRLAVRSFQQKHMIYEANYLRKKTVEALARPLLDNDYDGLVRALRERVVSAAAIVEDGIARTQAPAQPGRRVHQGGAGADGAHRRRQPRSRSSSATRRREFKSPARRRSSCRRGPTTTPTTWTSRSSSIAATSGTTCPFDARRATTGRSRARTTRR